MLANSLKLKTNNHNSKVRTNLRDLSYQFSLAIIKFVSSFPNKKLYWILSDQLLRSATSIGANIIEAKASSSKRDFIRFYQIALKSANETKYWLSLLRDGNLVSKTKVNPLITEADELCRMLASSLLTLKGKRKI
ncbi:MAG: four helix bundle protein [Patescibacteria group bacterium]